MLVKYLGAVNYAWDKRPESNRSKANKMLLEKSKIFTMKVEKFMVYEIHPILSICLLSFSLVLVF